MADKLTLPDWSVSGVLTINAYPPSIAIIAPMTINKVLLFIILFYTQFAATIYGMFFDIVFRYLSLALGITFLNFVPLFMPPTWMVLSFFYLHFHLAFAPTLIIGALSATIGRYILARSSKKYFSHFLSSQTQADLALTGQFINRKKIIALPLLMLFYAFSPIPSNQFFIAAGLINADLPLICLSFFLGRLMSYSFWLAVAHHTATNIQTIISEHLIRPQTYLIELATFVFLYFLQRFFVRLIVARSRQQPADQH